MTFLHFATCATLAYAPSWVIYKSTKVSETGYINLVYGFVGYALTLFARLLLMATFLPPETTTSTSSTTLFTHIDLIQEIVKTIITGLDIIGIYFVLSKAIGDKDVKILGVALGWSLGENLLSRLAPLWMGARGLEFEWKYIQMALLSNINMVFYIAFVTLIYLYSKKSIDERIKITLRFHMGLFLCFPLITEVVKHLFRIHDSWLILGIHTVLTLLGAAISYGMHIRHSKVY